MPLCDAHNHLQDDTLAPHLDALAASASALPLAAMVVNGTHPTDWPRVASLASRFPFVLPAYGVHPWDAASLSDHPAWLDQLTTRLTADPNASVGEIGIDRWLLQAPPDDPRLTGVPRPSWPEQLAVFLPQLALAASLNRPASLHCLRAWPQLLPLLRSSPLPARGFLLHAYAGPASLIPAFADLGAYFSFNGHFLHPRRAPTLAVFRHLPLDRLLLETDAPALPPPPAFRTPDSPLGPDRQPLNHPGNLPLVLPALASHLGLPPNSLESLLETNFHRLFRAQSQG